MPKSLEPFVFTKSDVWMSSEKSDGNWVQIMCKVFRILVFSQTGCPEDKLLYYFK